MGQMEPDALREKDVLRQDALTDVVRGESAITRAGHATVLGERPQPVEDTEIGAPGKQPEEQVEEGLTQQGKDGEHEQLAAQVPHGPNPATRPEQALERRLEVLVPRDADRVAHELAAQRRLRDRIAGVEEKVGFLLAELVAVVLRVGEPIPVAAIAEDEPSDQLLADPVVPSLVGEQQPVRSLVVEGQGPLEPRTHRDENEGIGRNRWSEWPVAGEDGKPAKQQREREGEHHVEGIRRIGNAAELGAELRTGATIGAQPLGARERRELRQSGRQSAGEVGDLVVVAHLRRQRGCHRRGSSGGEALGHGGMLHTVRHA